MSIRLHEMTTLALIELVDLQLMLHKMLLSWTICELCDDQIFT